MLFHTRLRISLALLILSCLSHQALACDSAITVTSGSNSGAGTLRQAVLDSCSGGAIDFDPSVTTVSLTSHIQIQQNLSIDGASSVTLDAGQNHRHIRVDAGYTVNLTG